MSLLKQPISDVPHSDSHSTTRNGETDRGGLMPGSKGSLVRHVSEAIATFAALGITTEQMEPLFQLQEVLGGTAPRANKAPTDNRREQPASDIILGRACAIIDLFIFSGKTPEEAAQTVTRQLASTEVFLSEQGGDSRAWKRLLNYRNLLLHGSQSQRTESREAYIQLKNDLRQIPPEKRIQVALEERLWDRRGGS